jgi:hypothetical protein
MCAGSSAGSGPPHARLVRFLQDATPPRFRAQQKAPHTVAPWCNACHRCSHAQPHPAARIAVNGDTWRAFRQAALVRGIPVSVYLGRLVEAELGRRKSTAIADLPSDAGPRDQALAALASVRESIDELDDIAGRLARSAHQVGGSWRDIASSLRLTEGAVRRAYDRPRAPVDDEPKV